MIFFRVFCRPCIEDWVISIIVFKIVICDCAVLVGEYCNEFQCCLNNRSLKISTIFVSVITAFTQNGWDFSKTDRSELIAMMKFLTKIFWNQKNDTKNSF